MTCRKRYLLLLTHRHVIIIGGIVTKGNVKIAISTNGKSPTTAKRLREFFEEVIQDINKWLKI
jgi:siroheme synthase (precorrin-2 oxidase/ferrochelatase)